MTQNDGLNVLSLFDGLSCGQIALERAGIKVNKYYASEIDKWAIGVTQYNYPNTIQIGDVTSVKGSDLPKIDLLLGGSPCQGFSFAGKQLNFDDPRSKLFFEFVRLLEEINPKYFLLENVIMKKEYEQTITDCLGVEPICINSSLLSAQNRKRLYWTNIPSVVQPIDKCVYVKDILDKFVDYKYYLQGKRLGWFEKNKEFQLRKKYCALHTLDSRDKAITMTARQFASWNGNYVVDGIGIRAATPTECERLQTTPCNYTNYGIINGVKREISQTQRYKMLGNGWTVDVIAHIFKSLKEVI